MDRIIRLIYSSRASGPFPEARLTALLRTSRANNASLGVTGMLLHIDGHFFQVLEGEQSAVDGLFARISGDPGHTRVTRIIREPIFERDFPEWTMGYARPDLRAVQEHLGENDFFTSATCLETISPGRARKLLLAFAQGRWRSEETGVHRTHRMAG